MTAGVLVAVAGTASLLTALVLAGSSTVLSGWAGHRQDAVLARVGRRSLGAAAAFVVLAALALEAALLGHLFQVAYVTEHTDRSLPTALLASAFYSGQEGSLLYWTLVLTVLSSVSLAASARSGVRLNAYATAVLAALSAFFLAVLVFAATPFALLGVVPADGLGLNPVLRDGGMLVHPPFLLAGFSSFAIPFAFAVAALASGRADSQWVAQTRRVALLAWGLQTAGLVLGMWWAYHVLGWGGYWGWDPVEDVALLPWLVTTAYIHSVQVQERRGQLKAWSFGLVIVAFLLSIFGTFLVRSGAVSSVHTFAVSEVGPWFFALLAVLLAGSLALLAARSGSLAPDQPMEMSVSREGALLLQNLLLAGLTAAVLWGVLLPLLSGAAGRPQVVGAGYYERVAGPIMFALVLLLAAGPLLPWRRAGRPRLRALAWPLTGGAAALGILLAAGVREPLALLAMPALAGAAATSIREYSRGAVFAGTPGAALRLASRHRRRYAAHLAHLGLVLAAAGIAGSHAWQDHRSATLAVGSVITVGGHTLALAGTGERVGAGGVVERYARLEAGGETLEPVRAAYPGGQVVSRVVIRSGPLEDVYVVLTDVGPGTATVNVFVNPLVTWIWAGAAILVLGILLGNLGSNTPAPQVARTAAAVAVPQS